MSVFLYKFFHKKTNERSERDLVKIPDNKQDWPERWKTIEYKVYKMFKPIHLPRKGGLLYGLLQERRSQGVSLGDNNPTQDTLSYILRCAYGLQENRGEHRTTPSAGQRYPLELYVLLFKDIQGISSGVYHYGVQRHELEPVTKTDMSEDVLKRFLPPHFPQEPHGIICIAAVFDRITDKYGSRGYRHLFLEAGHVAQNAILAGTEEGVNFIPAGGCDELAIEEYLGLNSNQEGIIYPLFF